MVARQCNNRVYLAVDKAANCFWQRCRSHASSSKGVDDFLLLCCKAVFVALIFPRFLKKPCSSELPPLRSLLLHHLHLRLQHRHFHAIEHLQPFSQTKMKKEGCPALSRTLRDIDVDEDSISEFALLSAHRMDVLDGLVQRGSKYTASSTLSSSCSPPTKGWAALLKKT